MVRRNDFVDNPARQCGEKLRFSSRVEAKRWARRKNFRTLTTYRCPHCRHWHLGNNR